MLFPWKSQMMHQRILSPSELMIGVTYLLELRNIFFEFHKLRKRLHTQTLTEEAPMNPFYREERNESSLPFPEFTPPDSEVFPTQIGVGNLEIMKTVKDDYDDHEGKRTISAVNHVNGITEFEFYYTYISNNWCRAHRFPLLAHSKHGEHRKPMDKDSEYLGCFDSSPPYSSEAVFSKYKGNRTYSSSVQIKAPDKHSGVRQVQWRLINTLTSGQIHEEGHYWIVNSMLQAADCTDSAKCYCIPMGDCFNIDMEFDFNNCWLAIDKPLLSNASFILELEAFNEAMLSSNVTLYEELSQDPNPSSCY
uniref:Uncharacterized protein n=1 Tax=Magallana gigas TaxID=29159 RepID=A0A8W8L008_MAGGI